MIEAAHRHFPWSRSSVIGVMVFLQVAIGCSSYREQPLSPQAVAAKLQTPDRATLSMQVQDFHHPRLAPVRIDPELDLDPDQLAVIAVLINPGLRTLRDERAVAEAQVIQAGILPNPQLAVGADLAVHGPDGTEKPGHSAGLGWEVTALITRSSRRDAAQAHTDAVALDVAWQEWQIAAATKTAAVRLAAAEQRLVLLEETSRMLTDRQDTIRRAVLAGWVSQLDEHAAALTAREAADLAFDLRQECIALRLQLRRLLGFPPDHPIGVRLAQWPTIIDIPVGLADELEVQRLDLLALRRGYDSQDALVRAAILGQFPKISLGLTHASDTGAVRTLALGLTVDLPFFDRNQGVIASEEATRQRLFDEYVQRLFDARHDLAAAISDAETTMLRITRQDGALTTMAADTSAVVAWSAAGQVDGGTAQTAVVQLAQKRGEALASRQHLAELRIAIELAAGRLLVVGGSPRDLDRKGP